MTGQKALLVLDNAASSDAYAAALADCGLEEARGQLDALSGEGLLTEAGYRRYVMHDLIRRYARRHAATESASTREQALERLLDYYQHAAAIAEDRLTRQTRPSRAPAAHQAPPASVPDLGVGDTTAALAWARAERDNLLACLDHAAAARQHARVTALTAAITALLRRDGPWPDAITRHTAPCRPHGTSVTPRRGQRPQRSGDRAAHDRGVSGGGTGAGGRAWRLPRHRRPGR